MFQVVFRRIAVFFLSPCGIRFICLPIVLGAIGFLVDAVLYSWGYTGKLGSMSQISYDESISGHYTDWHPPIYAVSFCIVRFISSSITSSQTSGIAHFYIFQSLLFWCGFFLVLQKGKNFWKKTNEMPVWKVGIICLLLFALWLDCLAASFQISKDFLFLACYLFATGCLLNLPKKRSMRLIVCLVALFFLFYGTALRHNALPALLPLLFLLVWLLFPAEKRRTLPLFFVSILLWFSYIGLNHFISYEVLKSDRLYPIQERFDADIFMLNYYGKHYENPPNGFGNNFENLNEADFRANYLHREMYAASNMRFVHPGHYSFSMEGEHISKNEKEVQGKHANLKKDYTALRNFWLRRIAQEPLTYLLVRGYFVSRFFFIDTPFYVFLITGTLINGAVLLSLCAVLCVSYLLGNPRVRQNEPLLTSFIFALSALLYTLPLFVFLTEDGPGNIRLLYWHYAASFISMALFCAYSPLFAEIMQTVQRYFQRRLDDEY
jgi:hypothetical protein